MTRAEFIKKLGILLTAFVAAIGLRKPEMILGDAPTDSGNTVVSATEPADKSKLWVDTANGGVVKFWNGHAWDYTKATWG